MRPRGRFVPCLALAAASLFVAAFLRAAGDAAKTPDAGLQPLVWGSVERMHRLGEIYLASQPAQADFELAKETGIKTVINLRKKEELDWDEKAAVEKVGMEYHDLGFQTPEELTDQIFDEARRLLASADKRPILLHCSSANRVGAIWLAHRVLDDGLRFDQARAEAETVGLKVPAFAEKARSYVGRRAAK